MQLPSDTPIQRYYLYGETEFAGYWVRALGWIAYYFAQLEGLSFKLILTLAPEADCPSLMRLPFQRRTEEAKVLVCSHFLAIEDQEAAEGWSMLLDDIGDAASLRNAILHNPFTIHMLASQGIQAPDEGIILMRRSDRPVIKLGAVQAFSEHVTELNRRMLFLLETRPPVGVGDD